MNRTSTPLLLCLLLLFASSPLRAQERVRFQAVEKGRQALWFHSPQAPTGGQPATSEKCLTMEADSLLRQQHPELGRLEDFEAWMARMKNTYLQQQAALRAPLLTLPVIFHIIHNGEAAGTGSNVSAALVQAQIDQLNDDFRRLGAGFNNNPAGADIEIEFCAATLDPAGNLLAEPGIERINRSSAGFNAPPYGTSYVDGTIKPATFWDPAQYVNIWVANLSGGTLGYAQFPVGSGLTGIPAGATAANTDGVVVLYSSVGSVGNPNPLGGSFGLGRTLTHEIGHYLGLRHIWGDGGCGVDDYCNDTPLSDAPNYSCPTGHVSCGSVDMIENYMDYTDDACMNIFTADQKTRIRTVLLNSPRRAELASSTRCAPPAPQIYFASGGGSIEEGSGIGASCERYADVNIVLRIGAAPLGTANVQVNVSGGTAVVPADADWLAGSTLSFPSGATGDQTLVLRVYDDAIVEGGETLNLSFTITNPGSTDASSASFNQTFTLSIADNDRDPLAVLGQELLYENFERPVAQIQADGWTTGSFSPSTNFWTINTSSPLNLTKSAHVTNASGALTYDNSDSHILLRTPAIDATGLSDLELEFLFQCRGELISVLGTTVYYDYGQIWYSLDGTNFTLLIDNIVGYTSTTLGTLALPAALDNQQFYLGFAWVNDGSTRRNPPFIVDNVRVYRPGVQIAEQINASRQESLGPGITAHFYDEASGDLMATIQNNGSYDYGCTEVQIDRAGNGAAEFWDNLSSDNRYDLASKTFRMIPENNAPGNNGNYTLTLYYTEAEVEGWENATGNVNSWAGAYVVKNGGAIANVSPGNPNPDGPVEVAANLATGSLPGGYFIRAGFGSGFSGFGVGVPGANPSFLIEYLSFDAQAEGRDVRLDWRFAGSAGIKSFLVERSPDGHHFEAAGTASANLGQGEELSMNYVDPEVARHHSPLLYYRLRGRDADGTEYISEIRSVAVSWAGWALRCYPSPFGSTLHAEISSQEAVHAGLRLLDLAGRTVWSGSAELLPGSQVLDIPAQALPAGSYLLEVRAAGRPPLIRKTMK